MADLDLRILMSAVGASGVISAVKSIGSALDKGGLGGALVATGVAAATMAVGVGVTAVKAAGDFQQSMTMLTTSAGESQKNIKMVGDGVLQMSVDTATSTQQLSAAMYTIESSGAHGASGLQILKVAAQGAKTENASLDVVAGALVTTMTDYHMKSSDAASAMNGLITAVKSGRMHLQDLSAAMAVVLPLAGSIHVGFAQVSGAMAVMTNAGEPARHAAQMLSFMMRDMVAPSGVASKAMTSVGLSATDVANTLQHKGLPQALQLIEDHVGKKFPEGSAEWTAAMKKIMGGAMGLNGVLELGGKNMATLTSNVADITKSMQAGGNSVLGWSDVQNNFNFKLQQAQQAVNALMIKIGQALLPVVTQLMGQIIPLITSFTDWLVQSGALTTGMNGLVTGVKTVVAVITTMVTIGSSVINFFQHNQVASAALMVAIGALGGVMALFAASSVANMILSLMEYGLSMLTAVAETVTGAATMTTTFGTMAGMIVASMGTAVASILAVAGPFLLIGAVVALVAIGVVLAVRNWGAISAWLQGVWSDVLTWLNGALKGAEGVIKSVVAGFNSALKSVEAPINAVIGWFNAWKTPILSVAGAITFFFLPAIIKAAVEAAISGGKIAISFVQSMITTGTQATINGAKVTASFIASMATSGAQAVVNGAKVTASFVASMATSGAQAVVNAAKVTASFVASMITTGVQAVVNAAKVTGSFVASLVTTGLEGWASAGKLAVFIGSMIATGTQAVIAAAKIVGSFVASLITTAAQSIATGATMVASLVPAIISVIVQATIAAAAAIPGLVAGFIAWTIGAGAAAIATIAATLPILLIIAAIALLVVGIVLLVTHWKQVTAFLGSAWKAACDLVTNLLHNLGGIFTSVFAGITNTVSNLVTGVLQRFGLMKSGVQQHIDDMRRNSDIQHSAMKATALAHTQEMATKNIANLEKQRIGIIAQLSQTKDPAARHMLEMKLQAVTTSEQQQQGVVQAAQKEKEQTLAHIQDLKNQEIDAHKNIFQHSWDWITQLYTNVTNGAKNMAGNVIATVAGWANGVINWFRSLQSQASGVIDVLWARVENAFNNAKATVSNIVSGIGQNIMSILNNLPAQAMAAGARIVNGIADGIRGAIGNVTSAIGNVTAAIGKFLPHSPAEEGELAHLNEYGPNLVGGFSKGIIASQPMLQKAMTALTGPVGSSFAAIANPNLMFSAASTGGTSSMMPSSVPSSSSSGGSASLPQGTPSNATITLSPVFNIYAQQVDSGEMQRIAQYAVTYFGEQIHAQFGNI